MGEFESALRAKLQGHGVVPIFVRSRATPELDPFLFPWSTYQPGQRQKRAASRSRKSQKTRRNRQRDRVARASRKRNR